ncbi:unnamed protein product [Mycena citricolor]|uniref:Uncharacterized protein n=1 Tax=Mycena citricolor TaxID=2018698 RepID=A0AAD2H180_9AGAR|nr:unnamed protein product [Mycena citricolor]
MTSSNGKASETSVCRTSVTAAEGSTDAAVQDAVRHQKRLRQTVAACTLGLVSDCFVLRHFL